MGERPFIRRGVDAKHRTLEARLIDVEPPSETGEAGSAGDRLSGTDQWIGGDGVSDDAAGAELDDSRFDVRAEEGDERSRPDDRDAGDGSGAEEFAG